MLQQYNQVFPGCAERIIKMAEDQGRHRQGLEQAVVQSKIGNERRGQWFAFVLGMTGILGAIYLVAIGRNLAGFGVFVVAQRKQAQELADKRREAESVRTPAG